MRIISMVFLGLSILPTVALAHSGGHEISGFASGLAHPILGIDHLLAMVAIGLIAAIYGGSMLWAMPLAFVCSMLAGAGIGLQGWVFPATEQWIVASVIILGLLALAPKSVALKAGFIGAAMIFGVFHGVAHGLEAPQAASVFGYLSGFLLATVALHGVGVFLGQKMSLKASRALGLGIAVLGTGLAVVG